MRAERTNLRRRRELSAYLTFHRHTSRNTTTTRPSVGSLAGNAARWPGWRRESALFYKQMLGGWPEAEGRLDSISVVLNWSQN